MQITHLLAPKVAACLSAVIAGSTVRALVDAVAGRCFCFVTRRADVLGSFVYICIPDLSGDFRWSLRTNSMAVLINIQ